MIILYIILGILALVGALVLIGPLGLIIVALVIAAVWIVKAMSD